MHIFFHPGAEKEVEESVDFYSVQGAGLAQKFQGSLALALRRIKEQPESFAIELGEFRACRLKDFPFTVYFTIHNDMIIVGAVAHHSRHPTYWASRTLGE